ncbi:2-keto-4-pentenoate hydratase [Nocardia asteroides]|uniref:2-keto-4-pentenoate hydratase n=1 Tax=Nocardia asteroides TaxID=1824 RepID=UPI001E4B8099|nr:fumarylacetoacetate hydrolase family protein [Nocardia asteroides]UGT63098.1 fumarylacetoacetate hydrolase family protein [Nocardia asteroides]
MTTVQPQTIEAAAARLAAAAATGIPCAPIRDLIASDDLASAYAIQQRNLAALLAGGRTVVGRKIGLTSPAVQRQLGVEQPDFGVLLDDFDCSGDAEVDFGRLLQPRIEAEIGFTLAADITGPITAAEAPGYVRTVHAALEIVDSRVANWDIAFADTVADNASSGLYVLGASLPVADAPDLEQVTMVLTSGGEQISAGRGTDCLGSPWAALAWLANTAREFGSPLRAGEIVLSGALGPLAPVAPGATYRAELSGIGSVTATFTNPESRKA